MTTSINNSNASSPTKKTRKSKSTVCNLEEVFNQISSVVDSDINPPLARIVLTPRSAEVCLKLGVNPETLKIRDIDSFWAPNQNPTIQRLKHEAYIQRRFDLMKQCRLERKKLSHESFSPAKDPRKDSAIEAALRLQEEQSSTLVKMEQQRLEKLKLKQQKELEQMVQYEANLAKIQAEVAQRTEEEKAKELVRRKQQEKREKLMAEERRLHDLQKVALEEAEEARRRRILKESFEKEQDLEMQRKRRMAEERKRSQEEEAERRRKHEEHQRQTQQYFDEEQRVLRERLESMKSAEQKKQDAIAQKQKEHAEKLRTRRQAIEERIQKNLKMAKYVEGKRLNNFMEKQMMFEETLAQRNKRLEEERTLHAQEVMLQEERRRLILAQQQEEEEIRKEALLKKFEEDQKHIREVAEEREQELAVATEKKRIRDAIKLENVDRVSRMGEYKRHSTLKKIESSDKRTQFMVTQRLSLIEARRAAAAKAKLQKETITRVMEEVRGSASKANRVVKLVQNGNMSIDNLIGPGGILNSVKKPKPKSKSSAELLDMNRASQSADSSSKGALMFDSGFGDAKTEDPRLYVSPYETDVKTASA